MGLWERRCDYGSVKESVGDEGEIIREVMKEGAGDEDSLLGRVGCTFGVYCLVGNN